MKYNKIKKFQNAGMINDSGYQEMGIEDSVASFLNLAQRLGKSPANDTMKAQGRGPSAAISAMTAAGAAGNMAMDLSRAIRLGQGMRNVMDEQTDRAAEIRRQQQTGYGSELGRQELFNTGYLYNDDLIQNVKDGGEIKSYANGGEISPENMATMMAFYSPRNSTFAGDVANTTYTGTNTRGKAKFDQVMRGLAFTESALLSPKVMKGLENVFGKKESPNPYIYMEADQQREIGPMDTTPMTEGEEIDLDTESSPFGDMWQLPETPEFAVGGLVALAPKILPMVAPMLGNMLGGSDKNTGETTDSLPLYRRGGRIKYKQKFKIRGRRGGRGGKIKYKEKFKTRGKLPEFPAVAPMAGNMLGGLDKKEGISEQEAEQLKNLAYNQGLTQGFYNMINTGLRGDLSTANMFPVNIEPTESLPLYKNGGETSVNPYELLSGEITTGLQNEQMVNAEVEAPEYLKFPDGMTQKVGGDRHSTGGEKMALPDGTKVLSDNIFVGKDGAKALSDELGFKVNPKNTAAKVLDRFRKRSGIQELFDTQESLLKDLEDVQETEDEQTRLVNEEYLSEQISQNQRQINNALGIESQVFDRLYNIQEEQKETKGQKARKQKTNDTPNTPVARIGSGSQAIPVFKSGKGYTTDSEENLVRLTEMAKDGGYKTIGDFLKDGGYIKPTNDTGEYIYKDGGYTVTRSDRKGKTHKVTGPDGTVKHFGDPNLKNKPKNEKAKKAWYARHKKNLENNPHFRAYARATWEDGGEVGEYKDGGKKEMIKRKDGSYSERGLWDNIRANKGSGKKPTKEMLEQERKIKAQSKQDGGETTTNPLDVAAEGAGYVFTPQQEVFDPQTGAVLFDPADPRTTTSRIQPAVGENIYTGGDAPVSFDRFKQANAWFFENNPDFDPTSVESGKEFQKSFNEELRKRARAAGMSDSEIENAVRQYGFGEGEGFEAVQQFDGKFGDYTMTRVLPDFIETPPVDIEPEEDVADPELKKDEEEKKLIKDTGEKEDWKKDEQEAMLPTPPQVETPYILPPMPLQLGAYSMPRLERITPIKVSPEAALRENQRATRMANQMVTTNLGSQVGGNIANILAQSLGANNEAVRQANITNAQLKQQSDQINLQQSNTERQLQDQELKRYSMEQLAALGETDRQFRDYLYRLSANRIAANRERRNLGIADAMSPTYTFDNQGNIMLTPGADQDLYSVLDPVALKSWQQAMGLTQQEG